MRTCFAFLVAAQGYIVRAAFPNLVLRSLEKRLNSNVDPKQIAVRLRWYEGKYCRRGGQVAGT